MKFLRSAWFYIRTALVVPYAIYKASRIEWKQGIRWVRPGWYTQNADGVWVYWHSLREDAMTEQTQQMHHKYMRARWFDDADQVPSVSRDGAKD